jgi:hypothetical protein
MRQFLLKMSSSAILISLILHACVFLCIFNQKSELIQPIEISIVLPSEPIESGNGLTKLPQLRDLMPQSRGGAGPGHNNQPATDADIEIARALEEAMEGNPFKKKEHKFYSYYERIRQDVEPLWASGVQDLVVTNRRQRTKWRISGGRVTTIVVMVDKSGKVLRVLLVKPSGDSRLDALSILLMRSRRYPNPPKDLIENDGLGRLVWYFRT